MQYACSMVARVYGVLPFRPPLSSTICLWICLFRSLSVSSAGLSRRFRSRSTASRQGLLEVCNAAGRNNESWKHKWRSNYIQEWKCKQLHGQWPVKITETTNNEKAFKWLIECGLNIKTESLIREAQDQVLNTTYHQTQILGILQDFKCRMFKETNLTVSHIQNMCPKTDY